MSEGPILPFRFQTSLAAMLAFTTVICVGLALVRAGHLEMAYAVAFPFAVGMVVGRFAPSRAWLLLSPFVAAFVVPAAWGALMSGFFDSPPDHAILEHAAGGAVVAILLLVPGMLVFGSIPAVAGGLFSWWLIPRRISENPISH
jgi:hypothetical protein